MKHTPDPRVGQMVPAVELCEMVDDQMKVVGARSLFGRKRCLVIGVPGAFTPTCTMQHVPNLVASAPKLLRSGFETLAVVVTSDPFSMDAWAKQVDPHHTVRFFSDGNLDFARGLSLISRETGYFLGERSERYLMTLRGGVIESLRIERSITDFACTDPLAHVMVES